MPVNRSLYKSLVKQYGAEKAPSIYAAMENEKKPSFKKGLKTAIKEKHTLKKLPKAKKK